MDGLKLLARKMQKTKKVSFGVWASHCCDQMSLWAHQHWYNCDSVASVPTSRPFLLSWFKKQPFLNAEFKITFIVLNQGTYLHSWGSQENLEARMLRRPLQEKNGCSREPETD
jgi:hypothetical protein